jgi:hypothetical protein
MLLIAVATLVTVVVISIEVQPMFDKRPHKFLLKLCAVDEPVRSDEPNLFDQACLLQAGN